MIQGLNRGSEEPVEGRVDRQGGLDDSSVRALLDHVAEELAAEFVRLMKESAAARSGDEQKEKTP
jgi:hypothetical protein